MADAPDIPEELQHILKAVSNKLTDELLESWLRGVCDGLEYAAQGIEAVLKQFDDSTTRDVLTGTMQGLRQAQAAVMVDGAAIVGGGHEHD